MAKEDTSRITTEEIASFCKRRGFVYPSGELYGGLAGFWDFGPLGVELKSNVKREWWKSNVHQREDMAGIDGSIITNPKTWEASGHVSHFVDIIAVCKKCKNKIKLDKHELKTAKCEKCGGKFESKGEFNPMFTTQVGPVKEDSIKAFLRPETAQLIFANFKSVQANSRMKLPFGISQIGKSFRNEISPRDFLFRLREFEQMEMEYFIDPNSPKCPYKIGEGKILIYSEEMQVKNKPAVEMKIKDALRKRIIGKDWHAYWIEQELNWFLGLGAKLPNFRIRQHLKEEKSHYSSDTWDLEFNFPFGWKELQGFADRGDFDLKQHEKFSKTSLEMVNEQQKKVLPHVVCEPALGVERAMLVFLLDAYTFDKKRNNIVLKLHPKLAPVKASVFPIIKKPQYEKISQGIVDELKQEFNVAYDRSGSIGKRYARNDEAGTPYCITIDEDSPKQKSITIRDRDSTKQIKVKIKDIKETLRKLINQEIKFEKAGKLVTTRVK